MKSTHGHDFRPVNFLEKTQVDGLTDGFESKLDIEKQKNISRQTFWTLTCLKVIFATLLLGGSFRLYIGEAEWIFMNNVNLIFHEAGHVLFMFFGSFLYALGGTLAEILIPSVIIVYFLMKQNHYGVGFGLWWLSIAFWSISIYVGDARERVLPLLGGGEGHDWAYLLGRLNIMEYDIFLANIFLLFSVVAVSFAVLYFYNDILRNYRSR
ncbi:MAG: hypothetical protein R3B53_03205 [Candidatus Paceibacterota bacterium]